MPWFIVWLDWCLYAYWEALLVCLSVVSIHYYFTTYSELRGFDFQLVSLISLCMWVVYCSIRNGYAVG